MSLFLRTGYINWSQKSLYMADFNSATWLKYGKKDMLTFNIFSYSGKQPALLRSFKYNDISLIYRFYSGCWKTELLLEMSVNQYAILFPQLNCPDFVLLLHPCHTDTICLILPILVSTGDCLCYFIDFSFFFFFSRKQTNKDINQIFIKNSQLLSTAYLLTDYTHTQAIPMQFMYQCIQWKLFSMKCQVVGRWLAALIYQGQII